MSITFPAPVRSTQTTKREALCHIACDHNEDVALCGRDISAEPWCDCRESCPNACVVCDDLDVVIP